jgi:hypothetical protein
LFRKRTPIQFGGQQQALRRGDLLIVALSQGRPQGLEQIQGCQIMPKQGIAERGEPGLVEGRPLGLQRRPGCLGLGDVAKTDHDALHRFAVPKRRTGGLKIEALVIRGCDLKTEPKSSPYWRVVSRALDLAPFGVRSSTGLRDPVCGMSVSADAAFWAERAGREYLFCSRGCRD